MKHGTVICLLFTVCFSLLVTGCRTAGPVGDALYLQQMERGAKSYAAGTLESARDHFTKAFRRALAIDDVSAAANAAHNSAMICAQLGAYSNALLYADAGIEALEMDRQSVPWDMLLLKSKIQVQLGQVAEAAETAKASLVITREVGSEAEAEVLLSLARIHLLLNDTSESRQILGDLTVTKLPDYLQAGYFVLSAELDSHDWQFDAAALNYQRAAALQQKTGLFNAMADSLYGAANAWQRAGYESKAGPYYLQAASAYYGQGRWVQALTAVRQAMSYADEIGNEDFGRQANVLFELLKNKVDSMNKEDLL